MPQSVRQARRHSAPMSVRPSVCLSGRVSGCQLTMHSVHQPRRDDRLPAGSRLPVPALQLHLILL